VTVCWPCSLFRSTVRCCGKGAVYNADLSPRFYERKATCLLLGRPKQTSPSPPCHPVQSHETVAGWLGSPAAPSSGNTLVKVRHPHRNDAEISLVAQIGVSGDSGILLAIVCIASRCLRLSLQPISVHDESLMLPHSCRPCFHELVRGNQGVDGQGWPAH